MTETSDATGRFFEIRCIAEEVQRHGLNSLTLPDIVGSLCTIALRAYCSCPMDTLEDGRCRVCQSERQDYECCRRLTNKPDAKLNLLCAAAHFSLVDLARDLLSDGQCPWVQNLLFEAPICIAARSGSKEMFYLLWDHVCRHCAEKKISEDAPYYLVQRAACLREDLDILGLVTTFVQQQDPSDFDPSSPQPNSDQRRFALRIANGSHARNVSSISAFKHLEEKVAHYDPDQLKHLYNPYHLIEHAAAGHVEIVRHLVGKKVALYINYWQNPRLRWQYALSEACLRAHDDVVDLLLENGADPRYPHPDSPWINEEGLDEAEMKSRKQMCKRINRPLTLAIKSGRTSTVEKMLNGGAKIEDAAFWAPAYSWSMPGLIHAVREEDKDMLDFLLERGASFEWPMTPEYHKIGDVAVCFAVKEGLESMVSFLGELGYVDLKLDIRRSLPSQLWSVKGNWRSFIDNWHNLTPT